ncbi:hypothetical protein [Thalassospira sp. TSL5-1]|uniref:hypothetical protein n=1 Tax=Thalassospira sp. TSL5-1 TaxID=1544451 RepID=UPI00143C96CE|nr:hypothetical protein [Thalassospira sp. TSL5-1]
MLIVHPYPFILFFLWAISLPCRIFRDQLHSAIFCVLCETHSATGLRSFQGQVATKGDYQQFMEQLAKNKREIDFKAIIYRRLPTGGLLPGLRNKRPALLLSGKRFSSAYRRRAESQTLWSLAPYPDPWPLVVCLLPAHWRLLPVNNAEAEHPVPFYKAF